MARVLMRSATMRVFLCLALLAGCTSDTLDNTTYRRLLESYDSYDHCLEESPNSCYQTLTFCADGRANANLEFRQEGPYSVRDAVAVAKLQTTTVYFDLEKRLSPQLPGRHRWELVEPLVIDCGR